MTSSDIRARGGRLSRSARRVQLLAAARGVFVANGYHAAAMDEIAERAGVSKPILYQHFPGKRDLYLALLDQCTQQLVESVRDALSSTTDNKARVAATLTAYFTFVDAESEAFRLIFESDLTSDPEVRALVARVSDECAAMLSAVIQEDTGLSPAEADLLGVALAGLARESAGYWLTTGRPIPRSAAENLVAQLSWRGIRGFPKHEDDRTMSATVTS